MMIVLTTQILLIMASNAAFNTIQANKPRRTAFDLSHSRKFTMNMGDLVPCMLQEVIPGDSFQLKMETLIRMMPMVAPIYHNINVWTHFFFVPYRLIWDDFEDFITGGREGTSTPSFPTVNENGIAASDVRDYFSKGKLSDYLGIPVKQFDDLSDGTALRFQFSQLPFRAYQLVYNEYYRDQNLIPEVSIPKSSGTSSIVSNPQLYQMRRRAWEKDYFTSALPWTQRGTQMSIPLTGDAAIEFSPVSSWGNNWKNPFTGASVNIGMSDYGMIATTPSGQSTARPQPDTGSGVSAAYDPQGSLVLNTQDLTTATINELRQAFQIQKWLERSARSGARYVEQILSHFGVRSSDARLDRPEFLGGGKTPIAISEVLQTSETGDTPLAEFAGHGISYGSSNRFRKFFEEHGFVIGIISVLPRTAYMQGLPRVFTKFDKYDYFWPEFAHLGEQDIPYRELYYDPRQSGYVENNESTFGYTGRYNEYRYVPDTVHGEMLDTLDYWHMAREFSSRPVLSGNFVSSDPTHRIFAVEDPGEQKLIVQTYNNLKAIRPIPRFGTPGGI